MSSDGEFVSIFQQNTQSTSTDALVLFGLLMGNDYDNGVSITVHTSKWSLFNFKFL